MFFSHQVLSCLLDPYTSTNQKALQSFGLGKKYDDAGDHRQAKTYFEQAIDHCPSSTYWILDEDECSTMDRFGPMCESQYDPIYHHANVYLGHIHLYEQDFREARYHYLRATGLHYYDEEENEYHYSFLYNVDPSWLIYLGLARLGSGSEDGALLHFENTIEHLDFVWTYLAEETQFLKKSGKNYPWFFEMAALAYANMAVAYYQQSEYELALEALLYAISIDEGRPFIDKENNVLFPYLNLSKAINKYPLKNPGNPSYYNNLGLIYLKLGRFEEALQAYNRALELNPEDLDTLKNLALVYLALENDQAAVSDYTSSLEKQPQDINSRKYRAMAYWCLGNREEADKEWILAEQWKEEILYQDNTRGLIALAKSDYAEAIQAFSLFIKSEPLLSLGYKNRGRTYYELGQLALALKDFDRALLLDEQDADAYQDRGAVHLSLSSYKKAVIDFQKAQDLCPKDPIICQKLGTAFLLNKDYDQAITSFTQAIGLDKSSKSYKNRGIAYVEKREFIKAISDFTQALTLGGADADTYKLRAMSHYEADKPQEAIKDFSQAIALGCQDSQIYCHRAVAYYTNREFPQAIDDFTQAMTLDSENVEAYRGRGLVWLSLNRVERAMEDLNQAILIENPHCPLPSSMTTKSVIPTTNSQHRSVPEARRIHRAAISRDGGKSYFYPILAKKRMGSSLQNLEGEEEPFDWNEVWFHFGLIKGAFSGGSESLKGMALLGYLLITHPLETSHEIFIHVKELIHYIRTQNWDKISESFVPELRHLYLNWDKLDAYQQGQLVGIAIGKYGIDVFASGSASKIFKNLGSSVAEVVVQEAKPLVVLKKGPFYLDPPATAFIEGIPIYPEGTWLMLTKGRAIIGTRCYTEHALARMAPAEVPEVVEILTERLHRKARQNGFEPGTELFYKWIDKSEKGKSFRLDNRGITPTEVEAEILHPRSTHFNVILNDTGGVITIIPRGKKNG